MSAQRVLAIGLDGYEESLERRFIEAGELPAIACLREQSARYLLDHGPAQRTGLAWEHVSTGLSPERAGRWAAVHFDPAQYAVWQEGTHLAPFSTWIRSRTVVFDTPYYDLKQAPHVNGLVGWGAHDPGVPLISHPPGLASEFKKLFGKYPAEQWLYGVVWPSAKRTREMGKSLTHAVDLRTRGARWLLGERLPNWDLAIIVVSEPHSAIEALWHGVDATHPLHQLPSAAPAYEGLLEVYRAIDRLIGELMTSFADTALVVFSMGGMGANRSDLASMVLLPELLYRHAFGSSLFRQPREWSELTSPLMLGKRETWAVAVNANFPPRAPKPTSRFASRHFLRAVQKATQRFVQRPELTTEHSDVRHSINWIPATHYRKYWRSMRAFALPSYYDGRIRINLMGREQEGRVPHSEYEQVCNEIESLLHECQDPITGDSIIDHMERIKDRDPLMLDSTESDIVIIWKGIWSAFDHPKLGRVGPLPFRRPGGHTGRFGMAYISNSGLEVGDRGVRSSFDVVPTLIELLGEPIPTGLSGTSLFTLNSGDKNVVHVPTRLDSCLR